MNRIVTALFSRRRSAKGPTPTVNSHRVKGPTVIEAHDVSGIDAWDPFLFTSPHALRDWEAGLFTNPDGTPRTLADLSWDLKTEVMRRESWTDEELQFRVILDGMVKAGLVEETEHYWHISPHGIVYRIRQTVRFRLSGQTFKLRRGRDLVFQCRMNRERLGVRGPFLTGTFSASTDYQLCRDMANEMMGNDRASRALQGFGHGDGRPASVDDSMGAPAGNSDNLATFWLSDAEALRTREVSRLPEIAPTLQVDGDTRAIYLLIDVSGSMEGKRLVSAKHALLTFLRSIPVGPKFRVGLRAFNGGISVLQGSLQKGFDAETRRSLMQTTSSLAADGSTALYQAVNCALDDLQLLVQNDRTPRWYLIVLSDGEDNQDIDCSYAGLKGQGALFRRVADLRADGPLVYLPIAYGTTVRALDRIGGPGFHADATDPAGILGKFADIRERLMLGLPTPSR